MERDKEGKRDKDGKRDRRNGDREGKRDREGVERLRGKGFRDTKRDKKRL